MRHVAISLLLLSACGVGPELGHSDVGTLGAAIEEGGELTLLTYNVAGLPEPFSGSSPDDYSPLIGPLLNGYDLVLVQEDFWYHWSLVAQVKHPYLSPPYSDEPTLSDIGDGLNQMSQFPFDSLQRDAWRECYGAVRCANDCLASKGFTFSTLSLSDDVIVHLYNLHMDAGSCEGDKRTRAVQMEQLLAHINKYSLGAPLIVAGDTNLEAAFGEDTATLNTFLTATNLHDVCRTLSCGVETIDRVMLRSSKNVILSALEWSQPVEFVDPYGDPLSDHLPTSARIAWKRKAAP